jgi:hypothetical protein
VLFDAGTLATAWLAVAQASGADKDHPILSNTVAVETYPEGVRLAATDGTMLLTAWVPDRDHDLVGEPALDDAPVTSLVAMDPDGRARGFMAYLHKLATAEDAEPIECRLTVAEFDDDGAFAGMAATWVMAEYPDHERLTLRCFDAPYPNWRALIAGFTARKTDAVALNPDLLGRLAKLGKLGSKSLIWRWGGQDKAAYVELEGTTVRGLVMPVRSAELREAEAA